MRWRSSCPYRREEDILARSNKKVRTEAPPGHGRRVDSIEPSTAKASPLETNYRGGAGTTPEADRDDITSEDDEDEEPEDESDSECPNFNLSKAEKSRIRCPYARTLIIKLLGRTIGYSVLLRKTNQLWRPRAPGELVAIENGFFLAKFSSEEDYNHAKFQGSWMIFNHYLTVQQRQLNFEPNENSLENLLVWVRIPCLPVLYYDYNFLMRVAARIAKPVKIDHATSV